MTVIVFPNARFGTWSLPVATDATRSLAKLYEGMCGSVDETSIELAIRAANGSIDSGKASFEEEYEGLIRGKFSAEHTKGDVLIVFPDKDDKRPVTVHTIDHVENDDVDVVVRRLVASLQAQVNRQVHASYRDPNPSVRELLEQL